MSIEAAASRAWTNETAASTPSSERSIGSTPELVPIPKEGDSPEPGTCRVLSPASKEHKEGGSRRGSFNDTGSRCSSLYLDQQQKNSEPSCFARHKCALIGATTFGIIGLIGAILAVAYFCIPGTKKAIGGAIKQQIGTAALVTLGMGSAFGVIAYMVAKKVIDSRTPESQDPFESVRKGAEAVKTQLQALQKKTQQNRHPLPAIWCLSTDPKLPESLHAPIKAVQQAIKSLNERSVVDRDDAAQTALQRSIQNVDRLEIQLQQSVQSGQSKEEQSELTRELANERVTLKTIRAPLGEKLTQHLDTLQEKTQDAINEAQNRYTREHLKGFKKDLDNVIAYRNDYQELAAKREQLKEELHNSLVDTLRDNKEKWQRIYDMLSNL